MSKLAKLSPRRTRLGRRVVRLKRYILNRRGDGVHSPYAFYLIAKVIRNRHPYYCFEELARMPSTSKLSFTRRQQEFLFHLVHQEGCRTACLVSAKGSTTAKYLGATKQLHALLLGLSAWEDEVPDILVIEDTRGIEVSELTSRLRQMLAGHERSFVVLAQHTKDSKQCSRELIAQAAPRVVIDLVDVLLIVQDNRLTYGRYKAFL